jgi:hypothetical protein
VCSNRSKAVKGLSFRYTSPQPSFQKHGLYFDSFSIQSHNIQYTGRRQIFDKSVGA